MNTSFRRARRHLPRAAVALLVALAALADAAEAPDPALQACWRAQQTQIRFEGEAPASINLDCVQTFGADGRVHAVCDGASGRTETTFQLEVTGPGTIRRTADQGDHRAVDTTWRVDDRWLMTSSPAQLPPDCHCTKSGVQTEVWVRVDDPARCQPLGSPARDRQSLFKSSIALDTPAGWTPAAGGTWPAGSFQIGKFVPAGQGTAVATQWVFLQDMMSELAEPVRGASFEGQRQLFVDALTRGGASKDCDLPDRTCMLKRQPVQGVGYSTLVNVDGRVVMIVGATHDSGAEAEDTLRRSVKLFTDTLLRGTAR